MYHGDLEGRRRMPGGERDLSSSRNSSQGEPEGDGELLQQLGRQKFPCEEKSLSSNAERTARVSSIPGGAAKSGEGEETPKRIARWSKVVTLAHFTGVRSKPEKKRRLKG